MTAKIRGLKYPLEIESGRLATAEDEDLIRSWILSVLQTYKGERIMQQQYGITDYIFQSKDVSEVASAINRELTRTIPQATFKANGSIDDTGLYWLTINWAVDNLEQPPIIFQLIN